MLNETQRRRHQKSKTGVPVVPQKGLMSSKNLKKKIYVKREGLAMWQENVWSNEIDDKSTFQ